MGVESCAGFEERIQRRNVADKRVHDVRSRKGKGAYSRRETATGERARP